MLIRTAGVLLLLLVTLDANDNNERCPLKSEYKMIHKCLDIHIIGFYTKNDRDNCISDVESLIFEYGCHELENMSKTKKGQGEIEDYFMKSRH